MNKKFKNEVEKKQLRTLYRKYEGKFYAIMCYAAIFMHASPLTTIRRRVSS